MLCLHSCYFNCNCFRTDLLKFGIFKDLDLDLNFKDFKGFKGVLLAVLLGGVRRSGWEEGPE